MVALSEEYLGGWSSHLPQRATDDGCSEIVKIVLLENN